MRRQYVYKGRGSNVHNVVIDRVDAVWMLCMRCVCSADELRPQCGGNVDNIVRRQCGSNVDAVWT